LTAWWDGLSPAEVVVDCGGEPHRLVWAAGSLRALQHPHPERERVLAVLGGEKQSCVDLLSAWERHADDPAVLLLASRAPDDVLAREDDQTRGGRRPPGFPEDPVAEVMELLRLGGGLPDRLVATVAANVTVEGQESRLHAALYGRLLAAMRMWLGQPQLAIELTVPAGEEPRSLRLEHDTVRVELPFAWLGEVWARGFTTILGRFCVAAESQDGYRWALSTVGPDFDGAEAIVLELPTVAGEA
jgi:hypothetical protein